MENTFPVGGNCVAVAAQQFDSPPDSAVDIVVAHADNGHLKERSSFLTLVRGDGGSGFLPPQHFHTALVPSGFSVFDFDGSGRPDVAVCAAHLSDSSPRPEPAFVSVHLNTNQATGSFVSDLVSSIDIEPNKEQNGRRIALGTFNPPISGAGDTYLDTAVAARAAAKVLVSRGNGDGTFTAPIAININTNPDPNTIERMPADLAVGDIGGDGDTDIVTADEGQPSGPSNPGITWISNPWVQTGTLIFVRHFLPPHPTLPGYLPQSVHLVDYTGDGMADLIEGAFIPGPPAVYKVFTYVWVPVQCFPGPPPYCTIEHFQIDREFTLLNSAHDFEVVSLDPQQDPYLDLVIALRGRTPSGGVVTDSCNRGPALQDQGGIGIIWNFTTSTPSSPLYLLNASTQDPRSVVVADLTGDGSLDIAVPSHCNDGVTIWRKSVAPSSFTYLVHQDVGSWPNSVKTGDFNSDGKLDLAVSCFHSNNLFILPGTGTDFFGTPFYVGAGTENYFIDVGNLNPIQDPGPTPKMDIVAVNQESDDLSVLLNVGP